MLIRLGQVRNLLPISLLALVVQGVRRELLITDVRLLILFIRFPSLRRSGFDPNILNELVSRMELYERQISSLRKEVDNFSFKTLRRTLTVES